jgi:hypothetical protein
MNELERVLEQVVTAFEGLRKKKISEKLSSGEVAWDLQSRHTQKNHAELPHTLTGTSKVKGIRKPKRSFSQGN